MFLSAGNGSTASHHRSSSLVPPVEGSGLLCPTLPNRRGSAPSGYQPPPPLAKPENTSTGFSLLSLVSAATKNTKGSNGAYSDMYALHERGESQSEAEQDDDNTGHGNESLENAECYFDGECDDNRVEYVADPATSVNFNVDNLKDMLKCVSCHRFLFPPILQCLSGHMECKNCFELKPQCGKCHQKMVEVPAKFAELIAEQFKVQCSYMERGCKECIVFKNRRDHEEICPFKPVQCPEFDCSVTRPMNEIFKHFRLEHHHHFVNAHGPVFNGDIRCDDSNMIMGVERKWAPTMMKLEEEDKSSSGAQHFFLEILRTKHGVWHMWIWYLGEPEEAGQFRCEIAIRKRARDDEAEIRYAGRVHSIRIPPHRIILSGCLLSFSDYTAAHFRYLGDGHQGHPVIDYRVSVSRNKRLLTGTQPNSRSSSQERSVPPKSGTVMTKMLRRFSIDSGGANKANKPNHGNNTDDNV